MNPILTTTNFVDGYVISEYLGLVSGNGSYLPGGAFGEGYGDKKQSSMFSSAYQTALQQLRSQAPSKNVQHL